MMIVARRWRVPTKAAAQAGIFPAWGAVFVGVSLQLLIGCTSGAAGPEGIGGSSTPTGTGGSGNGATGGTTTTGGFTGRGGASAMGGMAGHGQGTGGTGTGGRAAPTGGTTATGGVTTGGRGATGGMSTPGADAGVGDASNDRTNSGATGGAGGAAPRPTYYSDFDSGTSLAPFVTCWAFAPSYSRVVNGAVEFFYSQAAYDADPRRERKGTEICAPFETFRDGWYGFKIFLPSPGFPTNTNQIITQVFQKGACNSWAGHLDVVNQDLVIQHRSSCGTPTVATIYRNLPLNTWVPVIMYFKASNNNSGVIKVWVAGAPKGTPTYEKTGINFGFGVWTDGTTLAPGNQLTHKMGLYTDQGGDKMIRFDNIGLQPGNPADAFERVNPVR